MAPSQRRSSAPIRDIDGEPLVEHRLSGVAIERLEHEAHVPGVEDQVVDVEEDTAPGGTGTVTRLSSRAVYRVRQMTSVRTSPMRRSSIGSSARVNQVAEMRLTVIFEAERLDHVEHAIAKRARVRHLVEIRDGVRAWRGDPAHTLIDARRPRIRKLRRSCPGPHR